MTPSPTFDVFGHPHTLKLSNNQADGDSPRLCARCNHSASGWIYGCDPCKYVIHVHCCRFPDRIKLPLFDLHNHFLHLRTRLDDHQGEFICRACQQRGDGMCYMCETCEGHLHIRCAALRPTLDSLDTHVHDLHPIDLKCPRESKSFLCSVCGNDRHNQWLYRCEVCDIEVCLACARSKSMAKKKKNKESLEFSSNERNEIVSSMSPAQAKVKKDTSNSPMSKKTSKKKKERSSRKDTSDDDEDDDEEDDDDDDNHRKRRYSRYHRHHKGSSDEEEENNDDDDDDDHYKKEDHGMVNRDDLARSIKAGDDYDDDEDNNDDNDKDHNHKNNEVIKGRNLYLLESNIFFMMIMSLKKMISMMMVLLKMMISLTKTLSGINPIDYNANEDGDLTKNDKEYVLEENITSDKEEEDDGDEDGGDDEVKKITDDEIWNLWVRHSFE